MATFDNIFEQYIDEMLEDEEKRTIVEKYFSFYPEEKEKTIFDQTWYKEYVEKFKVFDFQVPEESKDDFDYDLLLRLTASSFSSQIQIIESEGLPDIKISVDNDGKFIAKTVSELWGFQILKLYEIYIEESINFAVHAASDEHERKEIENQRDYMLKKWNNLLFKHRTSQRLLEMV